MARKLSPEVGPRLVALYKESGLSIAAVARQAGYCAVSTRRLIMSLITAEEIAELTAAQRGSMLRERSTESMTRLLARLGPNNPNYMGKEAQPKSARYRLVRKDPIKDQVCEDCGKPAQIHHHRNEDTYDNSPENVAYLCRSCHMKEHHARGAFRKAPLTQLTDKAPTQPN